MELAQCSNEAARYPPVMRVSPQPSNGLLQTTRCPLQPRLLFCPTGIHA